MAHGLLTLYADLAYDTAGTAPSAGKGEQSPGGPLHFHFRPTLTGLGTAGLFQAARSTLPETRAGGPQAPAALFGPGGLKFATEALDLTIGETAIKGVAILTATGLSPGQWSGAVSLHAVNLDTLIAALKASKDAAAAGLLAFIRKAQALAKPDATGIVWQFTYQDGVLALNGVPLAAPAPARPIADPQ